MTPADPKPDHPKKALRDRAKVVRAEAAERLGEDGIRGFFEHLIRTWNVVCEAYGGETILAGYWPMVSEMDVRPALVALDQVHRWLGWSHTSSNTSVTSQVELPNVIRLRKSTCRRTSFTGAES